MWVKWGQPWTPCERGRYRLLMGVRGEGEQKQVTLLDLTRGVEIARAGRHYGKKTDFRRMTL